MKASRPEAESLNDKLARGVPASSFRPHHYLNGALAVIALLLVGLVATGLLLLHSWPRSLAAGEAQAERRTGKSAGEPVYPSGQYVNRATETERPGADF